MKSLPIVLSILLLQGTTVAQRTKTASIEGVVVKVGSADIRLQFSESPGGITGSNEKPKPGTGEPLSGATVELTIIATDRVRSFTVKTGRDGKFSFKDVPPGSGYELIAILSPDYLPAQFGQRYPGQPGTSISLAPGQQLKDARISMTRAASISGIVLDSGTPKVGAVSAIRPIYEGGRRVLGSLAYGKSGVVTTVSSNPKGEYRLSGLLPGQYYICVGVNGQTCYSDSEQGEPVPVNLRSGDNLTGLNLSFRSSELGMLRGEIVTAAGDAVESARIGLVTSDAVPNPPATPFRNSPPSFQFMAKPGSYFVVASSNGSVNPSFGYAPVKLRGSVDSHLRVVIESGFNISGQISGGSAPGARIHLLPLIPGMPNDPSTIVSESGAFSLRGVTPGEYRVEVSATVQETYLKSIRFGARDLPDGILRIAAKSNDRLEITLGGNAAAVGGRVLGVLNEKKALVAGIRVVLVPDSSHRDRHDLYKDALSDDEGRFELKGVAPGTYKLFAWELAQDGAWHDKEFLRLYEDLGKSVRVVEGSRDSFDVNPIPGWN